LPLPGGGSVIDTPGIRSFGLAHVSADDLLSAFADLAPGAEQCPPGCAHMDAADGCALDAWVADGHAETERLESYRRLAGARRADPEDLTR
jgi:ribosome biogenesis GTPase